MVADTPVPFTFEDLEELGFDDVLLVILPSILVLVLLLVFALVLRV